MTERQEFPFEKQDPVIEEMAKQGWLSRSSKAGITVLELGKKKARKTMELILACEEEELDVERYAVYITQLYLARVIEPNLKWKKK